MTCPPRTSACECHGTQRQRFQGATVPGSVHRQGLDGVVVHNSAAQLPDAAAAPQHPGVAPFDLPGALRRIRRLADLSQRELAQALGVSQAAVAQAESGRRDLPVGVLAGAASLPGLRLVLIDEHGAVVPVMADDRARDLGRRRFPAHLDPAHCDEFGRSYEPRRDRPEAWFTFRRDRGARDLRRDQAGTPADHPTYDATDSPAARAAVRAAAARRQREEARQRRLAGGERWADDGWTCTCPPECDALDDRSDALVHAADCPCSCDVG